MPKIDHKHPFDRKDQAPRRIPMEPDEIVEPGTQIREPGEATPEMDPDEEGASATSDPDGAKTTALEHAPAHEGATEDAIGDRVGPRAGYDDEPEQETDRGGVK